MKLMHKKRSRAEILLLVLLLLTCARLSSAQTPVAQPTSSPKPLASPLGDVTQQPESTDGPLVYGLQGVLIETLDGKTVSAQAADQAFNPASSVKLATALVAIQTFGPQHRFSTGLWTNGSFDKATGKILGNLYVTGRDPSFHYEHAVMVARQLNILGIHTVTGDLVIAPGFTMNFNASARRSGELLYDTLDATLRSGEATRSWTYERTTL